MRHLLNHLPFHLTWEAVAVPLIALVVIVGPGRWLLHKFLGRLFAAENARLARRGRLPWLRVGYASALLTALYVGFPGSMYADREEIARFAQDFSELFLIVQSMTVLMLTPLVFGGAVSDEKEAGSLDFLLTADLSAGEIVLGKFAARVLTVSTVMLTGLPVLALTFLWGGVDLLLVTTVFAATMLAMLSLGAMSLLLSVLCQRTLTATSWSYVTLTLLTICTIGAWPGEFVSPLSFQFAMIRPRPGTAPIDPLETLGYQLLTHGILTILSLSAAMAMLRPRSRRLVPRPRRSVLKPQLIPSSARVALTDWRPIGRFAVAWKENYLGRRGEPVVDSLWLYFGIAGGLLGLAAIFTDEMTYFRQSLQKLFHATGAVLTLGLGIGLLLQLAGTLTREREQRTLESLLAIPMSRGELLREKVLGALLRRSRWIIALGALLIVAVASGIFSLRGACLMAVLASAQVTFVIAVCLLVSLLTRTTVRAYVTSAVALAAVVVVTGLLARYTADANMGTASTSYAVRAALNPVVAWKYVEQVNSQVGEHPANLAICVLVSSLAYVVAAVILFEVTGWMFRRSEQYA